ncbi:hypothetical protein D0Z00_004535 [Geotrichum galactomycetum]|uniref:Uncharacterized protein n=1 Tax=Geotrichum galactomycetum TaxID=27317 RepID=A0ACB6UY55_9ASCO|nr:hypothetical protein D0Z00_004535 [Geotrichum candidum]
MKRPSTILATALTASAGLVSAGGADSSCTNIIGNYYCNEVSQVKYTNIGFQGSYNEVVSFDTNTCSCSSKPVTFSGTLAPFDQELSVHFRGPLELKQFAQYSFSSGNKRKRHLHHVHKRDVDEYETVYVTENLAITTTVYGNAAPAAATPESVSPNVKPQENSQQSSAKLESTPSKQDSSSPAVKVFSVHSNVAPAASSASAVTSSPAAVSSSLASTASKSTTSKKSSASGAGWSRDSYYNSKSSSASGVVFLNNLGGVNGSGVWDSCFGNSLSYCGSDGVSAAQEPTTLSDIFLPSNKEFTIFSDRACSGDSCGYYRPGTPAYHGFGGATKVFLFEFKMPLDPNSDAQINADMPAIWFLNAQIPRTLQYGNGECSCWGSGCGEFDVFEILNSGNKWLTSHLHSGQGSSDPSGSYGGGGTPDYIMRPIDSSMKAAVVFEEGSITISVLDDDASFDEFLSSETLSGWVKEKEDVATVFTLADDN